MIVCSQALLALGLLTSFETGAPESTLTVEVQNIKETTGSLYVGLYKRCKGFPTGCEPIDRQTVAVKSNPTRLTFAVEPGEYAIALYHDVNKNGKMDKKAFGLPKEPYGFSNNYRPIMSAPSFDDCQVQVGKDGKIISIKLL